MFEPLQCDCILQNIPIAKYLLKNNNKKQQLLRNSVIVIEKYMMFSVNNCYTGDLRKAVMLNHIIHENPMNRNSKQLLINQILLFSSDRDD